MFDEEEEEKEIGLPENAGIEAEESFRSSPKESIKERKEMKDAMLSPIAKEELEKVREETEEYFSSPNLLHQDSLLDFPDFSLIQSEKKEVKKLLLEVSEELQGIEESMKS